MGMEVAFRDCAEAWRGRGRPPRPVPDTVRDMADATYGTGKVGTVTVGPDDEQECKELVRMLRSYAKGSDRVMRIQRDADELRFWMVDKRRRT